MKIKGSELALFMEHAWPGDDWYWNHDLFDDQPDPDATYDTDELGGVLYQGRDQDPTDGDGYDIAVLVRKWRKERDFEVFSVTVPKERAVELKESIKAMGGKVS